MTRLWLVSVSGLALLASAPAMAGSKGEITQGGTGNRATNDQTRSTTRSVSTIEQNQGSNSGGANEAVVVQSDGGVVLKRDGSPLTLSNTSDVNQTGSGNRAFITQQQRIGAGGNVSQVSQSGAGNGTAGSGSLVDVSQIGHNESRITQTGNGSYGLVRQGLTVQPVGGDFSRITQGAGDTAAIYQNQVTPATVAGNYGGNDSTVIQARAVSYLSASYPALAK